MYIAHKKIRIAMKFDTQMIEETVKKESFYIHSPMSQNDYLALRAWARSQKFLISFYRPNEEITIYLPASKMKPSKARNASNTKRVYMVLAEANQVGSMSCAIFIDFVKPAYLRSMVSRFNKTSSIRWKVEELMGGKSVIYPDPAQRAKSVPADETENLI